MRYARIFSAIVVVALMVAGCTAETSDQTPPSPSPATEQAATSTAEVPETPQQVLEDFLRSWEELDLTGFNERVVPTRRVSDPSGIGQLEVLGEAVPVDYKLDPSMQREGDPTYSDACAFKVPVCFRGENLTVEPGERLDWNWILVKTDDGHWLVWDWGY
ncbi:MAG: hypothetical protein ABFC80_02210 [Coriobacteriales bacterium]|nr:hypothetical protein [Actinomycetes bacterium]